MNPKQLYRQIKSAERLQQRNSEDSLLICCNSIHFLINAKSHFFNPYERHSEFFGAFIRAIKARRQTNIGSIHIAAYYLIKDIRAIAFQPNYQHPTRKKTLQVQ